MSVRIHPTAIVEPTASIGTDVEIGPYSVIGPNVVLQDRCKLHHHVTVEGHTALGEGCEVFPQAVLGTQPQDIKYKGEKTLLEIGKGNIFREMVTVHPGTDNGGGITKIGDNNLFLIGVHIAHDCRIGNYCIFANYVQFAGHVHVEDHVNMGGHSAVHHFVTIGKHAFVGGMTRIPADVPPFVIIVAARGSRAEVRMINGVGLERCGFSIEDISALKDAYMKLFSRRARMNGTAIRDRVETILQNKLLNPQVEYLCNAMMRSFAYGRNGRYLESLRKDPVHRKNWVPEDKYNLKVDVIGKGSVQKSRGQSKGKSATSIELTATADPGWIFSGWNGNLSGQNNPQQITLDSDKIISANFKQKA